MPTPRDIEQGPQINEAVFNYVPVSQAMDDLADRTGFWWYINENRQLFFRSRGSVHGPAFDGADALADSLRVVTEAKKYRNQQVITGSRDLTSEQVERFKGNGEQRTFAVGFEIAKAPTIDVSTDGGSTWIPQDVGIKGIDTDRGWYWQAGSDTVTQNEEEDTLADGHLLRVTYIGEFPAVIISRDDLAITDRQTIEASGTGIVESVKTLTETMERQSTFQIAGQLLEKYGKIGRQLQFTTTEDLFRPGMIVPVNLPGHGVDSNMLVERVAIRTNEAGFLRYEVAMIEGPEKRSWQNLFMNMTREFEATIRVGADVGEIIIIPYEFERNWLEENDPNIFIEIYPSETLEPSTSLYPSFAPEHRIRLLEWFKDDGTIERKGITQIIGEDTDEIFTLTFLSPTDAVGDIEAFRWIGGINAATHLDTGIQIDEQTETTTGIEAPFTKTSSESWQIEKIDRKWS